MSKAPSSKAPTAAAHGEQVSASVFRAKLAHYLDRVKGGETVVVTVKGKPIAQLTAPAAAAAE